MAYFVEDDGMMIRRIVSMGIVSIVTTLSLLAAPVSAAEGYYWRELSTSPVAYWSGVASSADGSQVIAVQRSSAGGGLYRSTDGGNTWTPNAALGSRNWSGVVMSADGSTVAATACGGNIYVSQDGGITWTPQATTQNWAQIAISDDGTVVAATRTQNCSQSIPATSGSTVYISADSGATWTATSRTRTSGIAVSPDGSKIITSDSTSNSTTPSYPNYSTDGGLTWTASTSGYTNLWASFAFAGDNTTIYAYTGASSILNNSLYRSTDGGVTFTAVDGPYNTTNSPRTQVSRNGQLVMNNTGRFSTDSGATFNDMPDFPFAVDLRYSTFTDNNLRIYAVAGCTGGICSKSVGTLSYVYYPGAPANLTATRSGDDVELTWDTPTYTGGMATHDVLPIQDYTVEYSVDDATWLPIAYDINADGTSVTLPGLDQSDTLHFRVSAINRAGQGAPASTTLTPPVSTTPNLDPLEGLSSQTDTRIPGAPNTGIVRDQPVMPIAASSIFGLVVFGFGVALYRHRN